MEWLKMSPEYRVHTAVGNDGYEGPVSWMKTRQEILAENAKKMKEIMSKIKADNARFRLKKLEYKLRQERLKKQLKLIQGITTNEISEESKNTITCPKCGAKFDLRKEEEQS